MNLPRIKGARLASTFALIGSLLFCGGCAEIFGLSSHKSHRSSSVVAYLYPGKAEPLPPTSIPILRLPLRVGVAFVPASGGRGYSEGDYSFGAGLSEMQKNVLMRRVADEFKGREFIQSIDLIPSTYLRAGGGFENLTFTVADRATRRESSPRRSSPHNVCAQPA